MEFVISKQDGKALEKQWNQVAKINTSRQMFNSSLKNLCLNAVVGHLLQSPKDFDIRRLSLLPLVLKENMLYKLEVAYCNADQREIFKWMNFKEILGQLVDNISEISFNYAGYNTEPTKEEFRSGEFERILRAADEQMFKMLAQKCRKHLRVLNHGQNIYHEMIYSDNLKKHRVIWSSLMSLTNLRTLKLHRHLLNNEEFVLLGSKLANLVHLKCNLLNATWPGISEGLRPLKKLETFRFKLHFSKRCDGCTWGVCSFVQDVHQQCLKEYPQLREIGNCAFDSSPRRGFQSHFGKLCHSLDETTLFGPRSRSQLQHLVLRKTITQNQADWHKNVTSLKITWDLFNFIDYDPLLQFKNIKSLYLDHEVEIPTYVVMKFLQAYGQKLSSLNISANNRLTVEDILKMCPNLTNIGMTLLRMIRIGPDDGFGRPTRQQLDNLTFLYLDTLDVTDRPDVLVQIFTALNLGSLALHEVVADGFCLTRALHELQKEKVIAPNLHTLNLSPMEEYVTFPPNNIHVDLRYHWRLFLRYVSSHAPLLKNMVRSGEGELNLDDIVDKFNVRNTKYAPV